MIDAVNEHARGWYGEDSGENKIVLPDVKKTHVLYTFKGEESWQPLTELPDNKCKRCGLYEKDSIKADDIYDEWELCPDEFKGPDGKYIRFKHKEFNVTLLCAQCMADGCERGFKDCILFYTGPNKHVMKGSTDSAKAPRPVTKVGDKQMHLIWVIVISVSVSIVSLVAAVAAYKYWLRKKREKDQARFLKLFEEGDDIEDELGLGTII
ncbi:hypothetical protein ACLOJK_028063 [Asimina triloba]